MLVAVKTVRMKVPTLASKQSEKRSWEEDSFEEPSDMLDTWRKEGENKDTGYYSTSSLVQIYYQFCPCWTSNYAYDGSKLVFNCVISLWYWPNIPLDCPISWHLSWKEIWIVSSGLIVFICETFSAARYWPNTKLKSSVSQTGENCQLNQGFLRLDWLRYFCITNSAQIIFTKNC